MRRDEFGERRSLPNIVPAPHPDERHAREQPRQQPVWIAESHGNLRNLVCCKMTPNPSKPSDGSRAHR